MTVKSGSTLCSNEDLATASAMRPLVISRDPVRVSILSFYASLLVSRADPDQIGFYPRISS